MKENSTYILISCNNAVHSVHDDNNSTKMKRKKLNTCLYSCTQYAWDFTCAIRFNFLLNWRFLFYIFSNFITDVNSLYNITRHVNAFGFYGLIWSALHRLLYCCTHINILNLCVSCISCWFGMKWLEYDRLYRNGIHCVERMATYSGRAFIFVRIEWFGTCSLVTVVKYINKIPTQTPKPKTSHRAGRIQV